MDVPVIIIMSLCLVICVCFCWALHILLKKGNMNAILGMHIPVFETFIFVVAISILMATGVWIIANPRLTVAIIVGMLSLITYFQGWVSIRKGIKLIVFTEMYRLAKYLQEFGERRVENKGV